MTLEEEENVLSSAFAVNLMDNTNARINEATYSYLITDRNMKVRRGDGRLGWSLVGAFLMW